MNKYISKFSWNNGLPLYGIVHKYKVGHEEPLPIISTSERHMYKLESYRTC